MQYIQKILLFTFPVTMAFIACNNDEDYADATGVFESTEVIVSAEANGKIVKLQINEGDKIEKNKIIGLIDTTQLYLTKKQLEASRAAVLSGRPDVQSQIAATEREIAKQQREKKRIENLLAGDVATQKQLDDINASLEILDARLTAQKSSLHTSVASVDAQSQTIEAQIAIVNDQLAKSHIKSPLSGSVLVKYAEEGELTAMGKPLFKVADLTQMILRAYITGNQLSQIKVNQKVTVRTDDGNGGFKETDGIVKWINNKAEFTPKTIQTREERANKVYAIKIHVLNDGTYKIGMYGEVKL